MKGTSPASDGPGTFTRASVSDRYSANCWRFSSPDGPRRAGFDSPLPPSRLSRPAPTMAGSPPISWIGCKRTNRAYGIISTTSSWNLPPNGNPGKGSPGPICRAPCAGCILGRNCPQAVSRARFSPTKLLDAFPIHRLAWDAQAGALVRKGGGLGWHPIPMGKNAGAGTPARNGKRPARGPRPRQSGLRLGGFGDSAGLEAVLPDGYTLEFSPTAVSWWREAATRLGQGRMLTLDYGLTAEQWILPERTDGNPARLSKNIRWPRSTGRPWRQRPDVACQLHRLQRAGEEGRTRDHDADVPSQLPHANRGASMEEGFLGCGPGRGPRRANFRPSPTRGIWERPSGYCFSNELARRTSPIQGRLGRLGLGRRRDPDTAKTLGAGIGQLLTGNATDQPGAVVTEQLE